MVIAKYKAHIAALDEEVRKLRRGVDSSAPELCTEEAASEHQQAHRQTYEGGVDAEMADAEREPPDVRQAGVWL